MSAKYKSPSFLLPNELNTSTNPSLSADRASNYSMDFNSSDTTMLGFDPTINLSDTCSMSFWINLTATSGTNYTNNCPIGSATNYIVFLNNSSGVMWFRVGGNYLVLFNGNGDQSQSLNNFLTAGSWHHIVITRNQDDISVYINGYKRATNTQSSFSGDTVVSSIGAQGNNVNNTTGKIDEVTFYKRVLTDGGVATDSLATGDIAALYNSGSPASAATVLNLSPFTYYPLGEQAQNTGKLPEATANVWQFPNGVLQDYVVDFDGTDYIDLNASQSTMIGENADFTISVWFNTSTNNFQGVFGSFNTQRFYLAINRGTGRFYMALGGATNESGVMSFSLHTWHNITVVKNGTSIKYYLNGSLGSTVTHNGGNYGTHTQNLFLGAYNQSGNVNHFTGKLSNVAIWNTAITDANQIANIYNNGSPQTSYTVAPQNWWKLNADSVYTPSAPNYTTSLNLPQPLSASNYIDFPAGGSGWSFNDGAGNDTPFTVSAWVYNTSSTSKYRLLSKNNGGNGYEYSISAGGANALGSIEIYLYDSTGSGTYIGSKSTLHKPNEWVHVAFTYDASAAATGLKIYANGEQLTDTDVTVGSYTSMGIKTSKPNIGRTVTTVGSEGNVSNLTIFNSELTASQISTLFNFGTPETTPSFSPTLWFKLDNTTTGIQSAGSLTGASYNGTIGGSVTATSPAGVAVVPSWKIPNELPITTTPNYTTALDFVGGTSAGSGHSIDISSYTGLSNTSAFTVSIWFKGEDFSTDWIFSTSIAGDFGSNVIGLDLNNSGQLRPNIVFNGTSANISNVDIDLNKWYHAAITYDGSTGIATMYVNTVAYAGTNNLGSTTPTFSNNLVIAALEFRVASPSFGYYFDGLLSNMSIFNTALPATGSNSIKTLYNNGTPLISMSSFSSLQAWWKLDNLTTGIQDSSGNGYNGTNNGATQLTSDVLTPQPVNGVSTTLPSTALQQSDLQFDSPYSNYSLYFDGASSRVQALYNLPSGVTKFSVSIWGNVEGAGSSVNKCLISNESGNTADGYSLFTEGTYPNTKVWFKIENNASTQTTSNIVFGEWFHVLGTYDNGTAKIYFNGVLEDTTTGVPAINTSTLVSTMIGSYRESNPIIPMLGHLDEAAIWDTVALTDAQVLEIYNNGKPGDISTLSPTNWWRLGENAYFSNGNKIVTPNSIIGGVNGIGSGTVNDSLSANAPGTYANGVGTNLYIADRVGDAPLSIANSQSYNMIPDDKVPYVPGYVGDQISNTYSMTLDGTGYISLGSSLDFGTVNTICCWVYKTVNNCTLTGDAGNAAKYNIFSGQTQVYYRVGTPYAYWNYTLPLDTWVHFAFVRNGSNIDFYANAVKQNRINNPTFTISTKIDTIGDKSNGSHDGGAAPWVGNLDEFAVFNEALTADQIKFDLYNATTTGKTADIANNPNLPTPVAWYRMGD